MTNRQKSNGKNLVAYLVTSETIEKASLRESLTAVLPEYMIPADFVILDTIPKLPNGKVDLAALSAIEPHDSSCASGFVPPNTLTEKKLISTWEEILGVKPIGVNDNFFEIGGDSILSIQIVAKADNIGIRLEPNHLFEKQTIAELAKVAVIKNSDDDPLNELGDTGSDLDAGSQDFGHADVSEKDLNTILDQIK